MTGEAEEPAREVPEEHGLCYIDLSRTDFAPGAASWLPEETARRERAVPIDRRGSVTVVAVANPATDVTMESLRAATGGEVFAVVAPAGQVTAAISRLYGEPTAAMRSRRRGYDVHAQGPAGTTVDPQSPLADEPQVSFFAPEDPQSPLADEPQVSFFAPEDPQSPPTTLEESLRDVLVPPEPIDLVPPEPGQYHTSHSTTPGVVTSEPTPHESPAPALEDPIISMPTLLQSTVPSPEPATERDAPVSHRPPPPPPPPPGFAPTDVETPPAPPAESVPPPPPPPPPPVGRPGKARTEPGQPVAPQWSTQPAAATPPPAPPVNAPAPPAPPVEATAPPAPPVEATAPPAPPVDAPAPPGSNGKAPLPTVVIAGQPISPAPPTPPSANGHAATSQPARPVREGEGRALVDAGSPGGGPAPPGASPPQPLPGNGSPGGEAGDVQAPVRWPALARVLLESGRVPYEDMARALRDHVQLGESLAAYLQREGLVTEEDLVRAMAQEVGLEFADLSTEPVDPTVASLVPDAVARRHMMLPVRIVDGTPVVAMADPTDVFAMDALRSIMGRNFTAVVAMRSQIDQHLRRIFDSGNDVQAAAQSAEGAFGDEAAGFELESIQSVVDDAPIVRYVNLLILQALNERASDIHIEPTPRRMQIKFRIDGVMHDASSASPAIQSAVISRLKVLGDMDITEHRIPQEGRVSVGVGDRQIDLRIAVLPSLYGETCVMRLLDKSASIRRLSDLGFLPDTLQRYSQCYGQPYGVILVTGPTGAGKTTTLYATLQEVMSREKSVVTVEDPVEYQIEGITQVQINPKAGLHFSKALRSILRADPDIILVGEVRDIETATIAMEAALSGHLVLTTLHTNTAASTPLRLTEMGIEPFLVTSAVTGVLTQRLARVLCEKCKTPFEASMEDFYAAGYREPDLEGLDTSTLWRANGCRTCSHTGYYGRMILAEVMPMTEEVERMIIEQRSIVAMEREAVDQGMRTLRHDGLRKALAGQTTLDEVLRVVV